MSDELVNPPATTLLSGSSKLTATSSIYYTDGPRLIAFEPFETAPIGRITLKMTSALTSPFDPLASFVLTPETGNVSRLLTSANDNRSIELGTGRDLAVAHFRGDTLVFWVGEDDHLAGVRITSQPGAGDESPKAMIEPLPESLLAHTFAIAHGRRPLVVTANDDQLVILLVAAVLGPLQSVHASVLAVDDQGMLQATPFSPAAEAASAPHVVALDEPPVLPTADEATQVAPQPLASSDRPDLHAMLDARFEEPLTNRFAALTAKIVEHGSSSTTQHVGSSTLVDLGSHGADVDTHDALAPKHHADQTLSIVSGGAGDDVLAGDFSGKYIDGGTGTDRVVYHASKFAVSVTPNGDGSFTVALADGTGAEDRVVHVEELSFDDGNLVLHDLPKFAAAPDAEPQHQPLTQPHVVALGDLGFAVTWSEAGDNGKPVDFVQLFGPDHHPISAVTEITPTAATPDHSGTDAPAMPTSAADNAHTAVSDAAPASPSTVHAQAEVPAQTAEVGHHELPAPLTGPAAETPVVVVDDHTVRLANSGDDVAVGTSGRDVVDGGSGDDVLLGRGGDDILIGGSGNDYVAGGDGHDVLFGGTGADVLDGGAGNDVLYGGFGRDTIIGGAGDDTISFEGEFTGVRVDLSAGTTQRGVDGHAPSVDAPIEDVVSGVENATGGYGDDDLIGDGGDNVLIGLAGGDRIEGRGGDDTIIGGDGIDVAVYRGAVTEYEIDLKLHAVIEVRDTVERRDGKDQVSGVEYFEFAGIKFSSTEVLSLVEHGHGGGRDGSSTPVEVIGGGSLPTAVLAEDLAAPPQSSTNASVVSSDPAAFVIKFTAATDDGGSNSGRSDSSGSSGPSGTAGSADFLAALDSSGSHGDSGTSGSSGASGSSGTSGSSSGSGTSGSQGGLSAFDSSGSPDNSGSSGLSGSSSTSHDTSGSSRGSGSSSGSGVPAALVTFGSSGSGGGTGSSGSSGSTDTSGGSNMLGFTGSQGGSGSSGSSGSSDASAPILVASSATWLEPVTADRWFDALKDFFHDTIDFAKTSIAATAVVAERYAELAGAFGADTLIFEAEHSGHVELAQELTTHHAFDVHTLEDFAHHLQDAIETLQVHDPLPSDFLTKTFPALGHIDVPFV